MKKFAKYFFLCSLVVIFLVCIPASVKSNPSDPADPACDPLDPGCPIDGGLGILLAAGIGYGIKIVKGNRKKEAGQTLL